jgi:short-subunit dehydrogenase
MRAATAKQRYGPWALVAGASDGIGAAFATALASRGLNLVLVARRSDLLDKLAESLTRKHEVEVRTVVADLATPSGPADVLEFTGSTVDVGLLVCNAALSPVAPFVDLSVAEVDAVLELNVRAAARLTHAYGRQMVARGRGGVILLSSMASLQGSATIAHYAATKAYLRVLAEGLWYEWRPHGVDVLACCPGLVATPTYKRGSPSPGLLVPGPMRPRTVARKALAALGRRPVTVPGLRNRVSARVATLLPRRAAIAVSSRQTAAMYRR